MQNLRPGEDLLSGPVSNLLSHAMLQVQSLPCIEPRDYAMVSCIASPLYTQRLNRAIAYTATQAGYISSKLSQEGRAQAMQVLNFLSSSETSWSLVLDQDTGTTQCDSEVLIAVQWQGSLAEVKICHVSFEHCVVIKEI